MASALSGAISVLILGGTTHLSRPLLKWLLDPAQDAARSNVEIKHIRLADKFLASNGTSTTYIEPDTWEALKDPRVEYRQVNLNLAPNLPKVYDHPDGGSYDVVFDFTGEGVGQPDVPEELLIERTAKLAHSIAAESLPGCRPGRWPRSLRRWRRLSAGRRRASTSARWASCCCLRGSGAAKYQR